MQQFVAFGISTVARFVGMLAEQFAQWVLHRIRDGSEAGADFFTELCEFGGSFLQMLAGQLFGRPIRQFDQFEEEYRHAR